jgi:hypothetical protein
VNIEHISIRCPIESIARSIEEEETFPTSNRRFDEKLSLIKNERTVFILEWSDIMIVDGDEVDHFVITFIFI